jgi:hypothetical protein
MIITDISGEATSDKFSTLKKEKLTSKEMVADLVLRYDIIKKLKITRLTYKFKKDI